MIQINKRQEQVLAIIKQGVGRTSGIIVEVVKTFPKTSRITLIRDLNQLVKLNFMVRVGRGRNTKYQISPRLALFEPVNVKQYFQTEPDKRVVKDTFSWQIFELLNNILTAQELNELEGLSNIYRLESKRMPPEIAKQEMERLIIEFSWKSSLIEGNTYTLLDTERLIKEGKVAKGRKKEEAHMILNHKRAFDYLLKNIKDWQKISVAKIEDIHYLLVKNLGITRNMRKTPVGIVGTKYRPLDNICQIKEAMEKMCNIVNKEPNPFAKSIILMLLIAYTQPFTDGNKRTSRLLANGVLLAHGAPLLSLRSIDEGEYKKAVILFYELNNLTYFKQLFLEQLRFSVEN